MPHLNIPGSDFFCFKPNQPPNWNLIAGHDIVVVQRCCTPGQFQFIETAASLGIKIVYDLDDDVWNLPIYNPAHHILNQFKEGFIHCIRMVDVVTVSTRTLAKVVRKNVKTMTNQRTGKDIPILVAENRMDERMFVVPVKNEKSKLTVGWAGSTSHIGDLQLVQDALVNCHKEIDFNINFRGCNVQEDNPIAKLSGYEFSYWMPVPEFGARMPLWDWDIALAPVTDHDFNASKSSIKMIESAYCGIPTLASWVKPYEDFCQHDSELMWLLCALPSVYERKLRELLNDSARRIELGRRCQTVAKDYYSFNREHEEWKQVFETVRNI